MEKQLTPYEIEMFEFMDAENAAEEERIREMEIELWAAMDAEREEEEEREREMWRIIEEENEREHDEDISIWFEVIEGRNDELKKFALSRKCKAHDKAQYKALDRALAKQGVLFKME